MYMAQCHRPPLVGMYTMYHSLMIILIKSWIYLKCSSKFKEFKALIENLSVRKIKILRSDNGREYTSKEFVNFCKICWDQEDPQQNGVAEWKNRTILEAMKTMIHDQDLPMCLWVEATMAAIYVQNP
jgi:hypothetical protein